MRPRWRLLALVFQPGLFKVTGKPLMRSARFLPPILSINLPPRPPRRSRPRPRFVSSWFRGRARARERLGSWSRCAILDSWRLSLLLLGMSLLDRSALAATVELVVDTTQAIG